MTVQHMIHEFGRGLQSVYGQTVVSSDDNCRYFRIGVSMTGELRPWMHSSARFVIFVFDDGEMQATFYGTDINVRHTQTVLGKYITGFPEQEFFLALELCRRAAIDAGVDPATWTGPQVPQSPEETQP